jgi:hypothetical protein
MFLKIFVRTIILNLPWVREKIINVQLGKIALVKHVLGNFS